MLGPYLSFSMFGSQIKFVQFQQTQTSLMNPPISNCEPSTSNVTKSPSEYNVPDLLRLERERKKVCARPILRHAVFNL